MRDAKGFRFIVRAELVRFADGTSGYCKKEKPRITLMLAVRGSLGE
jgi:hypothetical protein